MSASATTAAKGVHPLARFLPGFDAPIGSHVRGIVIGEPTTPDLVWSVLQAVPPCPDGYCTPVFVLDPDGDRADAAIEAIPTSHRWRVRRFAGTDFEDRFLDACEGCLEYGLPRHVIGSGPSAREWLPGVVARIQSLGDRQSREIATLRDRLDGRWCDRGPSHWGRRFESIASGASAMRLLLVTTRYTTFVHHSASDLASSFESLGHEPHLLIEPEACWLTGPLRTLRAMDRLDPDLIVVVNYPRAGHEAMFPEGWPFLCWVQDGMPHLFDGSRRAGPLDFVAGHLYPEMIERAGYEASACLEHPVCASSVKFHPGPVSASSGSRFGCDVAYVSHQSEPASVFHDRSVGGVLPALRPLLEACRAEIERAIGQWPFSAQDNAIDSAWRRVVSAIGATENAQMSAALKHQYAYPLAELMIRHETLSWAAEVAQDQGLTLKLFGRGWERHPTLARFAAGALEHGEDLRACYQGARVHLHASVRGCGHQRVYECALSGGVPLCRRSWGEFFRHEAEVQREFVDSGRRPDASMLPHRTPAWIIADHPELLALLRQRQLSVTPVVGWDHADREGLFGRLDDEVFLYWDECRVPPASMRPLKILGDPFELTFSTRDELAELVQRAVRGGGWREDASSALRGRVEATVSLRLFARRIVETVSGRLRAGADR